MQSVSLGSVREHSYTMKESLRALKTNLQFCGDRRMVDTGYPQCIVASHSFPSDQDILHCVIQGMAHVQLTCDVRRGHYDAKRFFGFVNFCMEVFLFHPCVVKSFLYYRGVKILCQLFHISFLPFFHLEKSTVKYRKSFRPRKDESSRYHLYFRPETDGHSIGL